ncbi:hypothetical protein ACWOAH_11260 [Vagococcus vulneris]|uniref:DUF536 domain-containing protein n=1 Tax=Vagococcus vulneris TaxID=1977869 RepID=A0A429ZQQ4_9ENTE|nr:hypothetical protein [Vagococcus vulneris]RST96017.1 hypothetical protein CBF37_11270 [Vagococcus vulneris]
MITFGRFAKQYKVPRASVYSIMKDLERDNSELYNQCVDASSGTNKLTQKGINYILEARGLDKETLSEQQLETFETVDKHSSDSDVLQAIEVLKKELETRNKQFDNLQTSYNQLAQSMADLTKNQQLLTKQLQDNNMYIDSLKQSQDKSNTVQDSRYTDLDDDSSTTNRTEKQKKKGFFSRIFS